MNHDLVEKVVHAVLYEGLILYPYRPSSKKNRHRFTFGRVYPEEYSVAQKGAEPCRMQTECLIQTSQPPSEQAVVKVSVRFLQPMAREIGVGPEFRIVPELVIDGKRYQTWHEAVERVVEVAPFSPEALFQCTHRFEFPALRECEPISDREGVARGVILRRQEAVAGRVEIYAEHIAGNLLKLRVRILNATHMFSSDLEEQEPILMRTFVSTHTVLQVTGGEFLSLLDPPAFHAATAAQCKSIGCWPVLVGDETSGERDTLLSSPIILYDYPKIAPESPGDLFDGTEIDEILTLRVLTLTEDEKAEMRNGDAHARRILERTEALSTDHLLKMHGALREVCAQTEAFFNPENRSEGATVQGVPLKPGDRVRIHPKNRADVMDLALAGKVGIIEAIERDVEDRIHFALVIEDDPGREFGMNRYPGHRFFFASDEIEPLEDL